MKKTLVQKWNSIFVNHRIVFKVLMGYVLIVLLPIFLFSGYLYIQAHNRLVDDYINNRKEFVEQAKNNFEQDLNQVESIYQLFQYNKNMLEYLSGFYNTETQHVYNLVKYIRPVYSFIYSSNPDIVDIQIYNLDPEALTIGPEFDTLEALISKQPEYASIKALKITQGLWIMEDTDQETGARLMYYQNIYNEDFSKKIGILEIETTDSVFENCFKTSRPGTTMGL